MALVDLADLPLVLPYKWHVSCGGRYPYARAYVKGRTLVPMHRLILGAEKGEDVDHVDGDTLNNRRTNLRRCDRMQNLGNQPARHDGFKGVYRGGPKWRARIAKQEIGRFATEREAAMAYDSAARERWGSFAALNFPEVGERSALTGQIQLAPVVRGPGVSLTQINNPATGAELLSTRSEA